ncbi:yggX [Wigglesworthia glossinidia endosymbiont of Glossina brevipalpis]|uniref:Probable Fe(2+)-trafficking protein n=1 Tax=Wigglesworthia glossinidia brevipalpis TaxID=36870 RepID=FETP_WIGBR|nr:RecName: Full=Probable Fe(2+)-trafficking protein [Wigglesworthia glossinidia endosymbiont of Glossina brevipalpis]BAC24222.1 yggX [Wigglesworthia glossinidia endosymbiont of Glossina brevipalpis]
MKRNIFCHFMKNFHERLDFPPYPGSIGKKIYKNISKKAWEIWKNHQTILINEKQLNMLNKKDRKTIEIEMINFLFKNK